MMKQLLSIQDLCFAYDKEIILDHVCTEIMEGDFVGVIGSNGTGKSTLIRLLLGQLRPVSGEITILGTPVGQFRDWPKIGYVPQVGGDAHREFPATAKEIVVLSEFSDIKFMRMTRRHHIDRAVQALEAVEMGEFKNRQLSALSGGQFQRVMIAKALVNEPKLLILDEPTSGIDAHSKKILFRLLKNLNQQGITILMVTHDIKETEQYVNRFLELKDQTICEVRMGEH